MRWGATLFAFVAMFSGIGCLADDATQLGRLSGEKFSIFYTDHAMSGQINGKLIFAVPLDNEFGIKLSHRAFGKNFETIFKANTDQPKMGGTITSVDEGGKEKQTAVAIQKIDPKKGLIEGTVGEMPFTLKVTSTAMEGHHYVNPEFQLTVGDAQYPFSLSNGKACMGCISKITFVVVGMLRSTGVL